MGHLKEVILKKSSVARYVSEDAFPQQCQQRFVRTLDPTILHGPWTNEEDAKLRSAVAVYGNSWTDVAEVIQGRTNEQCRDRKASPFRELEFQVLRSPRSPAMRSLDPDSRT